MEGLTSHPPKRHDPCSENGNSHSDDGGSELSSPERTCEPCSEDGSSVLDDQSPGTHLVNRISQKKKRKEKRGKQTKTVEATDGGSDLSSELDVVAVDQSPGTRQKHSQKKKKMKMKKRGKQTKTVEEGVLKKPVLKVKRPWSDAKRSAVHERPVYNVLKRRAPWMEDPGKT